MRRKKERKKERERERGVAGGSSHEGSSSLGRRGRRESGGVELLARSDSWSQGSEQIRVGRAKRKETSSVRVAGLRSQAKAAARRN